MPTWCHMFKSTLTGNAKVWFDDLPTDSIDSYDDLKKAFLENYLQQKKCIKYPIELHNIKQCDGESTEDFVRRKAVALNKRAQIKQSKETTQGDKERRNLQKGQSISYPHDEEKGTEGPVIIEAEIGGHCIHRIYVDGESASEILYEQCFNRLRLKIKNQLVLATTLLIGFSSEVIWPIGQIQLQTRSQETASSFINSSRNAEAPSRMRSNYPKKQQVGPTGILGYDRRPKAHCRTPLKRGGRMLFEEGMFLGYKINTKGLKVCLDNVDVVLSLPSPKCLNDVQKLNGKLASLNRFLAKSTEKSLPFFKTLKKCTKKSDFHWTTKAEEAFKQMKQLIAELPMLTTPMEKEELIVYLAAAKATVSAVLMTEREAKQRPIYFVTRALRGPEINYTSMEKLVLALNQLWALVKEYLSIRLATSEKEMELWVELKRLYEPDPEDQLWTLTRNF
nr:reverse transcriptase domain-containing protein [Tanacetum cinerariifolium]